MSWQGGQVETAVAAARAADPQGPAGLDWRGWLCGHWPAARASPRSGTCGEDGEDPARPQRPLASRVRPGVIRHRDRRGDHQRRARGCLPGARGPPGSQQAPGRCLGARSPPGWPVIPGHTVRGSRTRETDGSGCGRGFSGMGQSSRAAGESLTLDKSGFRDRFWHPPAEDFFSYPGRARAGTGEDAGLTACFPAAMPAEPPATGCRRSPRRDRWPGRPLLACGRPSLCSSDGPITRDALGLLHRVHIVSGSRSLTRTSPA